MTQNIRMQRHTDKQVKFQPACYVQGIATSVTMPFPTNPILAVGGEIGSYLFRILRRGDYFWEEI